ncbi:MAG: YeiH family protein [Marmoricola sp.]
MSTEPGRTRPNHLEMAPIVRALGARLPGLGAATAIALVATLVGHDLPLLGAPVAAIVIGVALSPVLRGGAALESGLRFASQALLQLAVVVLGSQLSLKQIAGVGISSLPVMIGTLAACLSVAYLVGRVMRLDGDLNTLIGVGTAICGASAIAAVSPVIRARSHVIAYAISTIFFFNIAAVLVFPPLGHALGLTQEQFGLFAGTAVNDTSSVVAAASTYGAVAANHAVVVKLTRTLMIIPICLALGAIVERRRRKTHGHRADSESGAATVPRVPRFLVGFLAAAGLNTMGAIPAAAHAPLQQTSVFLITIALAAIGLLTDFRAMRRAGLKPWLLGAILWIVVASSSLVLQWAA